MRVSAQATFDKAEFAARRDRLLAGIPDGTARALWRDVAQPQEQCGLAVQPMESFFTLLSFVAWNRGGELGGARGRGNAARGVVPGAVLPGRDPGNRVLQGALH